MAEEGKIIVRKAKVNNLKDITVEIPRGKFVVITGISGSGKSSLAFDTLFAEGQRRFAESLSSYARQFLGRMSKPDVELIEGIPPAIAIEQKVNTRNPRSTIATSTEIYDYLRMIYARIGRTYSPVTGLEVKCSTATDVLDYIYEEGASAAYILADLNWNARTDKVELMLQLKEEGYTDAGGISNIMHRIGNDRNTSGKKTACKFKYRKGQIQDKCDQNILLRVHKNATLSSILPPPRGGVSLLYPFRNKSQVSVSFTFCVVRIISIDFTSC